MDFAPKREPLVDASSADRSIEMYPDGTPVRRNKHGKKLAQSARAGAGKPPIDYDPDYHPKQTYELALLGLTDARIAAIFQISERTFNTWKLLHPELSAALQRGKLPADGEVARSLHQRATGFSCKTTKLFYDQKHDKVIEHEIEEYYPPHVGAIIMWLTNRQRNLWKSRADQTLPGPTGEALVPPTLVIRAFDPAKGSARSERGG